MVFCFTCFGALAAAILPDHKGAQLKNDGMSKRYAYESQEKRNGSRVSCFILIEAEWTESAISKRGIRFQKVV